MLLGTAHPATDGLRASTKNTITLAAGRGPSQGTVDTKRTLFEAQAQLSDLLKQREELERQIKGLVQVIEGLRVLGEKPDWENPPVPARVGIAAMAVPGYIPEYTSKRARLKARELTRAEKDALEGMGVNQKSILKRATEKDQKQE